MKLDWQPNYRTWHQWHSATEETVLPPRSNSVVQLTDIYVTHVVARVASIIICLSFAQKCDTRRQTGRMMLPTRPTTKSSTFVTRDGPSRPSEGYASPSMRGPQQLKGFQPIYLIIIIINIVMSSAWCTIIDREHTRGCVHRRVPNRAKALSVGCANP